MTTRQKAGETRETAVRQDSDIAIVATAQLPAVRRQELTETEMLLMVVDEALGKVDLKRSDIGFSCQGSCDYISGGTFSFVPNLDAMGAWPPIHESHVEMDGAWAMYEAWVRLRHGDIDIAVAMGSGKSSTGDPAAIYPLELDPYYLAPLGLDPVSLAALQARQLIESGKSTERELAEIAARSRRDAAGNPNQQVRTAEQDVDKLLAEGYLRNPLRRSDLPPISDGACAVVLVRGPRAAELTERPAWITGIDHRSEVHNPALRDLTDSASTRLAATRAGGVAGVEVAELMAPFTAQEVILRQSLGLADDVLINPSGGALTGNPLMATGLVRIADAAEAILADGRSRTLGHATSGPALQQNLVCVLEGDNR
ncbi:lipid-transfer protein [Embleya hyalina]|uniref:Lipid-transfer protein n=1 Tax=Embleya hyalina TaxID=516124 RepID=A0A401YHX8_9ACTN|nr:lipid-transfer protein [Embleya hyalina]GCD94179.1 lipid-transfer protein [Embleya hyalina]